MQQFDVAGGKLECHGLHVIFCLSVFVYVKHSGTCNFTSLSFWVCFAIGSAIFKEHSVALMLKMQLYSIKRTNLESALFWMTLITAKSLHVHTFPHSYANNFHYIWGRCQLLHPCEEKLVRYIEDSELCFFNWMFCNTYFPLVGLWSASFYFYYRMCSWWWLIMVGTRP
jgi:hypothetical protein